VLHGGRRRARAAAARAARSDWRIKARYYEACTCAHGCPCNFTGFPTHGKYEATVAFAVDEGGRVGVDLAGVKVGTAIMWPGAIHDGNGKWPSSSTPNPTSSVRRS
jgi:hypothetical protein